MDIQKIKILINLNKEKVSNVAIFILIALYYIVAIFTIYENIFPTRIYPFNKLIALRLISFISLNLSFLTIWFINKHLKGIKECLYKFTYIYTAISILIILIFIAKLIYLENVIKIIGCLYCLIVLLGITTSKIEEILKLKYVKVGILVIAIISIVSPLFWSNYLNSETYVQKEILNKTIAGKIDNSIEITVKNSVNQEIILKRITQINGEGLNKTPHAFNYEIKNNILTIQSSIGGDLSTYCLFIKEEQFKKFNIFSCDDKFGINSKSNIFQKRQEIIEEDLFDDNIKQLYVKKIDSYLSDSSKKILDKELVELMLVRGYFFNHYN